MEPQYYYRAAHLEGAYSDKKWIREQLYKIPTHKHKTVCEKYSEVYMTEGRRAANTRLRLYADKLLESRKE